jgi:hypothetical protein
MDIRTEDEGSGLQGCEWTCRVVGEGEREARSVHWSLFDKKECFCDSQATSVDHGTYRRTGRMHIPSIDPSEGQT